MTVHLKTLPSLPNELLAHIASFLPSNELKRLYSVSSVFFQLAMDEIYGEVQLSHPIDPSTRRCLMNLDDKVATHVRTLVIRPDYNLFADAKPLVTSPKRRFRFKSLLFRLLGRKIKLAEVPHPYASIIQHLPERIAHMTKLEALLVQCYALDSWSAFDQSLPAIRSAFVHSATLRSLTLDLPTACMVTMLPTIFLSGLQHLAFSLRFSGGSVELTDVYHCLATFINKHSSILRRLGIHLPSYLPDSALFYQKIANLSSLVDLSLGIPVEHLSLTTFVDTFLQKYADRIQSFTFKTYDHDTIPILSFTNPRTFFDCPIFKRRLWSLKTLSITIPHWALYRDDEVADLSVGLATYLDQLSLSLQKLVVAGGRLNREVIGAATQVLTGCPNFRSLNLGVDSFDAGVFDILAENLPDLDELFIDFAYLNYWFNHTFGPYTREQILAKNFMQQMKPRRYPDWRLRSLHTELPFPIAGVKYRQTLLDSFPAVVYFNDLSRRDFLEGHL